MMKQRETDGEEAAQDKVHHKDDSGEVVRGRTIHGEDSARVKVVLHLEADNILKQLLHAGTIPILEMTLVTAAKRARL